MTQSKTLRNARGFTLIEVAIVLTIVGLVIGGIWLAASTVTGNQKKTALAQDVVQIVQNLRNMYNNQSVTTGLTTPVAIQAGAIPANLVVATGANGTARNVYSSAAGSLDVISPAANQFQISLTGIPQDACIELLSSRLAQSEEAARRIGLFSAKGNGGAILQAGFAGGITPAEAIGTCTNVAAGNNMVLIFTK